MPRASSPSGTALTSSSASTRVILRRPGRPQVRSTSSTVTCRPRGVQAAGQRDFIHQLVQLGDVAQDFGRKGGRGGVCPHQLQPHADAGERRAQLVRGIGQRGDCGASPGFQSLDRRVELPGQGRPLRPARCRERAPTGRLRQTSSRCAAGLEPQRQPPDDGVHAQGDRHAHDAQHPHK